MTDKALAARLREQATLYRAFNQTGRDRAGDLDRAADLIEQMAQPLTDAQIDATLQTEPEAILALADVRGMTAGTFKQVLRKLSRAIEVAHGIVDRQEDAA